MKKIQSPDQYHSVCADALNHNAKLVNNSLSENSILQRLRIFASSVQDFRRTGRGNIRHRLDDIIMLLILGQLSNHIGRSSIIEFGRHNLKKFQKLGILLNGVPSEPTLCRIENGLNDISFAGKMQQFVGKYHTELHNAIYVKEIICIDGKAQRGTVQENGRNPDIVSAYSFDTGIVLATEACEEKSNEIKAIPILIDKIDIKDKIITADAMSMQKDIINKIREKEGDFIIELKANQRSLRYGVEDRIVNATPVYSYKEEPVLSHGRIETRYYRIYDGLELIANKQKWGCGLTIIECESFIVKKSTGEQTTEKRLYVSSLPTSTPELGAIIRSHWSIEIMHWGLDTNLRQDKIKRKWAKAARNLDTIQRIVYSIFSIWKNLRKKRTDKRKGMAKLMRSISMSFTKLIRFLSQKLKK